ncbi:MAG: hypothetical protein OQJ96_03350 [Flavobacteriales bacterium]|nr:hypothetical protein [Flavobacteriales bacterium]MCW8912392.1 hypothetical protein [Flavobacteriales bacterium]MCW8936476.1 hypothetical protein [Flavobacteriales bacterium]MCW8967542.1 hypothetical protein [Flavobacteriales bacterium]MCW8989531.1 hypothetical protein [Flavobacteriales bacterium]
MNKIIVITIFVLFFFSCNNEKVNVFMENTSFNDSEIDIQVLFNGKLVIESNFKTDSITPNYKVFKVTKPCCENYFNLTIISKKAGIRYEKTINSEEDKNIYIEYQYKVINDSLGLLKTEGYKRIGNSFNYIIIPKKFEVFTSPYSAIIE